MSDTDQLLEILQADVFAVLKATPTLATANVLADNEGEIESRVARAISTMTATGGKSGLAVVVLLPEVNQAEPNLPGPVMSIKVEIRVLENVLINRNATHGTLIRSSQAALRVLSALHHRGLGSRLLCAEKSPITPVDVKTGFVSHAVTLFCRENGVTPAEKPLAVQAEMFDFTGCIQVSGTVPASTLKLLPGGPAGGKQAYSSDGMGPTFIRTNFPYSEITYASGHWQYIYHASATAITVWDGAAGGIQNDPFAVTSWALGVNPGGSSGSPVLASVTAATLDLYSNTPESITYYTTDGSFPSPASNQVYGSIPNLQAGTIVRAAAYVTGMAPSDVTEILIS